jgi:hypothetical protein
MTSAGKVLLSAAEGLLAAKILLDAGGVYVGGLGGVQPGVRL